MDKEQLKKGEEKEKEEKMKKRQVRTFTNVHLLEKTVFTFFSIFGIQLSHRSRSRSREHNR